jgi:glycosyltransferase involved in cell wall biosynthesis
VVRCIQAVYANTLQDHDAMVSVVIPAYNYADKLPRAVESVINQTYGDLKEIIIVDDGSTDNTPQVAEELVRADCRVRYIRQTNGGVANARNTGISHATSTYISCLDADDEMKPPFLETMVNALEQDRGVRLAYSKIELVFPNGDRGVGPWPNEFDPDAMLRGENQIPTCCVFHKQDWQRLGGYKQRYCPQGFGAEDAEFWLRFAKHGYRAKLVTDEPLFVYHLGGGTQKDYQEPDWLVWHTDLRTDWVPFAALNNDGVHPVVDYEDPTYSVIIPVGPGHEIYLEDALDSVEAQTDKRWECIVVWNMPADILVTNPLVDRLHFAYPFVKFVVATEKQGAGYARNVGADIAKGDYLVFLDADDYLQPRFLELTRKALEHFGAGWVYTDIYTQTADGLSYFECYEWDIEKLWRHGIMGVTCLYPKDAYDAVGGFDEEHNREDWDFHLRLARAGMCGLRVPLPLFTYRQHLGYRREYRKVATSVEESQAMKREDVKRLHETFGVKELEMACVGCGGKRVNIRSVSDNDLLTMEYVGRNQAMSNEVTFRGPVTGKSYRTVEGTIINVHPDDAGAFQERGLFQPVKTVEPEKPIVSHTPKQPKVEKTVAWEDEQLQINAEMQKAADEARSETEKHLESLFGTMHPSEIPEWINDPSKLTVSEIKEKVEGDLPMPAWIERAYRAEAGGKNRVTALRFLRTYLPDDFDDAE